MPQVRRPIPSLLNGVSQQPPSLRHPSQCAALVNGYPSLASGLSKRAPSQHLAKISTTAWTDAHTHVINWSSTLQFLVVCIDNDLKVFDFDGTEKTVNFPDGKTYLNVTDPVTDFATVTVGDVVYVANKTITVAQTATTAGGTYKGKVQDFASLPTSGMVDGDVWQIVGDDSLYTTGYYMKWVNADLVWVESAKPGDLIELDPTTMPLELSYNSGTGQFTLQEPTWAQRGAGDSTSLPDPSFLGLAIRDLFFYRNRFGVLAGETMTLSRSGPDFADFFYQTASTELDTDPINLRAANVNVSTLNHAVPYNRQLMAFSDKAQFTLSTAIGQILKGTTAALDVATSYTANAVAKPISAAASMFFPSEDTLFANLREYIVSSDSEVVDIAEEITAHVHQFIPAGIYKMVNVEEEDLMLCLTTGNQTRLYVYKYYWLNNEKIQSSWSYWQFDTSETILSIDVIDSSIYLLVKRSDGVYLERIDLTDDPSLSDLGFTCLLDSRDELSGTYDSGTDTTSWTLPYKHADVATTPVIVKGGSWAGEEGSTIKVKDLTSTHTIRSDGDHSAHNVYIGVPYTFTYRFSEQFLRKSEENDGGSPILQGHLILRNLWVRFYDTGYLRAEVTPRDGETPYEYIYNGMTLGSTALIIGSPRIDKGTLRIPVLANSKNVQIDIINDKHVPHALVSAEWNGTFNSKAGGV
jgi:hypothetical protein